MPLIPFPPPPDTPTLPYRTGSEPRHPAVTIETYARMVAYALEDSRRAIASDGESGVIAEFTCIPRKYAVPLAARYVGTGASRAGTYHPYVRHAFGHETAYLKLWRLGEQHP